MHFQFAVWYSNTIPFLAWYSINPKQSQSFFVWLLRCSLVCLLTLLVELSFLFTQTDIVYGPNGNKWISEGTPTKLGSIVLTTTHIALLVLLFIKHDGTSIVTSIESGQTKTD